MGKKYMVIRPDGATTYIEGKELSLEELQKLVGGYVEMVKLYRQEFHTMWVNEEGYRLELPPNPKASLMAGHALVGTAVLEGGSK